MVSSHPTGNVLGGRPARQNWGKFDAHKWGGFNARSHFGRGVARVASRRAHATALQGRPCLSPAPPHARCSIIRSGQRAVHAPPRPYDLGTGAPVAAYPIASGLGNRSPVAPTRTWEALASGPGRSHEGLVAGKSMTTEAIIPLA